jgi:hypothetical protein
LNPTVAPILTAPFSGGTCGSLKLIDYWSGKSTSAVDVMGINAATKAGFAVSSFDFAVVFIPKCSSIGFSGELNVTICALVNLIPIDILLKPLQL